MTERHGAIEDRHTEMAHGHTRLIWLLDDIEAHLEGLGEDSEERALILEELVSFARSFTDELDGHIAEEESTLFPAAEAVADDAERDELATIYAEHRDLEEHVQDFWALLSRACDGSDGRHGVCLDTLFEKVRSIREHLTAHSSHERAFLGRIEPRVEDSSFKV